MQAYLAFVLRESTRRRLISSSNFPRFDVNPNTGEPVGMSRRIVVADNSIFHTASRSSHVVLPIVPRAPVTSSPRR